MGTSKLDINELLIEIRRIKARWLDWLNDPPPDADYDLEQMRVLVTTLDAHGRFYIQSVRDKASCDEFMRTIREAGSAILDNAIHRRAAERFREANGLPPAPALAGLPAGILGDVLMRFEARYAHWDAEALERTTSRRPLPAGSARERVSEFLDRASDSAKVKITRSMFWGAAGYTEATAFEDFQAEKSRTSRMAKKNFERLLKMPPEEFLDLLKKKNLLK